MAGRPIFHRTPSTIQEFDGDSSEGLSEASVEDTENDQGAASSSRQVVSTSQHVHTNLLLVALLDHLSAIYVKDELERYKLFKALVDALVAGNILKGFGSLDEASSLRSQYKTAFSKLLTTAIATVQQKEFPISNIQQRAGLFLQPRLNARAPLSIPSINTILTTNISRYHEDFQQIRRVGYGAYGSVFKVKNKLDNCEYAIKKISFESSEPELWLKIINEVKLLAQLSHKHVVRYHNAWIEYDNPALMPYPEAAEHSDIKGLPAPQTVPALTYSFASHDSRSLPKHTTLEDQNDQDDSIIFAETSGIEPSAQRVNEPMSSASISDSFSSSSIDGQLSSQSTDGISHVNGTRVLKPVVVLHIQMELCSYTLKDWIQVRNEKVRDSVLDKYSAVDAETNLCLLKQILKALSFIHENKLMHRDIKPKNIFLTPCDSADGKDMAKIGDFGLARQASGIDEPLTPHPGRPPTSPQSSKDQYTCGVGTTIYAAPEQLNGSHYTQKCDMYSIGLVIFEMYHPFKTEMERIGSLNDLRKNILPEEFVNHWPEQACFIGELLAEDSDLRPSAADLLHSEMFRSRLQVISMLRKENLTLEQENTRLRKLLDKRDSEIAMLRREIVNITPKKK